MQAYEVTKGTKVKVIDNVVFVPPNALPVYQHEILKIGTLDGMHCRATNEKGDTVYIKASYFDEYEWLKYEETIGVIME